MAKGTKKPISLLGLGVGSAERLKTLHPKKGRLVVGVDSNRKKAFHQKKGKRVVRKVAGAKLIYGAKGDAERVLRGLIAEGRKVKVFNAEYFFANLGKQHNFPDAHWANIEIANKASKEILDLVKQVLVPNGRIRLEACKFDSIRWKKVLKKSGFVVTSVKKVPEDKIAGWWSKWHQRYKIEYNNRDYEPIQIIARMK